MYSCDINISFDVQVQYFVWWFLMMPLYCMVEIFFLSMLDYFWTSYKQFLLKLFSYTYDEFIAGD